MQPNFTYVKAMMLFFCSLLSISLFSQTTTEEWKSRIRKNLGTIGITAADADECTISSSYKDAVSGIEYAYIQQTYQQLRVFNNIITLAYKDGRVVHASGKFVNNIREMNLKAAPNVEAGNALTTSARHLNLKVPVTVQTRLNKFQAERKIVFMPNGIAKKDIETELLWVEDTAQKVHLAWNVNIDVAGSADWWNVRVDAQSGEVVNKDNWTVHENSTPVQNRSEGSWVKNYHPSSYNPFAAYNQIKTTSSPSFWIPPNVESASYLVVPFPYESRNFGPVTIDVNPWLKAGAGNPATTYGWHFDGTDNYLISRGNNVWAYDDSANRNTAGRVVTSTTPAPNVTFNVMPDFSKQPFDSTNRNFALVNLFYWNNIIHDVTYQYGFDENAGNFQANNLGRGGAGNDYVRAEAQDGSGTDNANFSTPTDGSSGRMQMYLWSAVPQVTITAPSTIAGSYVAAESGFSTSNKLLRLGSVTGQIVSYDDAGDTTHLGCDSSQAPKNPVTGKIALMYRGGTSCSFTTKFRSAQKAGAIAVIMVNNVAGAPITMGGTDNAVVIPGVMVSMDDGAKIAAQVPNGVTITLATGIQIDGDIDNGIVTHEYGHGVSNRLTGGRVNASCLGNAEQGGEGWSDYLALMLTTDWSTAQTTDGPKPKPMGTYAEGQPATGAGIRRFPYSTNLLVDTLTYANVASNTEVHAIGEVWCTALWDMTWYIIQHENKITSSIYNSTGGGGNTIALKLVIEGMKLQPCRPGFLDARNAILAADSILYGYRHKCDIWNAFARRGMGVSAIQGLSTSASDQVPAYDVPSGIIIKKSALPASVAAGQSTTVGMTATCQCQVPTSGFSVTDTLPAGFTYVSSNQGGVLAGNVVKFNTVRFTNALDSLDLNIVLTATGAACAVINSVSDDRDTDSTGNLVSASLSGNSNWVSSTNHAYSGTRAYYAADSSRLTNFTLTSAPFTAGNLSVLSFWHYYVTENGLDGGKVEISPDNGSTWVDAGPYFLQNGYNTLLNALAPQPNTPAFSGTSYATGSNNNGQFIESLVNLSSFSGKTIQIRFRFITNATNASSQFYDGWYIDDIDVNNGCGGISKFILNSSSGKADSLSVPTFIIPAQLVPTTTLITLAARQAGTEVVLNWQTTAEVNTRNFTIERSADGITWTTIGYVTAQGAGSASYSYVDASPMDVNHYRIRVNNKDWNYSYTPEKLVQFAQTGITSISPNPASDQSVIYFAGRVTGAELLVTDLTGRIMQRHIVSDNAVSYKLQTGNLPPGTYLVKMQLKTGTMVTKKLVIGR